MSSSWTNYTASATRSSTGASLTPTASLRALQAAPSTARYGTYTAPPLPKHEVRAAAPSIAAAAAASQKSSLYRSAAAAAAPPSAAAVGPPQAAASSFITQVSKAAPRPVPLSASAAPRGGARPKCSPQLPPHPAMNGRPLLVLDLDETLVHASVDPVPHDVSFSVPMEHQTVVVYVKLRPGVYEFLRLAARLFEVAVFTASLSQYADQVVDYLDPQGTLVHHRLFREHCTFVDGSYVKDLSLLGRPLETIAIVDNSPVAYSFHQENAIAITSWFDDPRDRELTALAPLLRDFAATRNIYESLNGGASPTSATAVGRRRVDLL